MQITVEYTAQVKQTAGVARETIDLPAACTLTQCLKHVAASHGSPLADLLLSADGNLSPALLYFICDSQVANGDDPRLKERDIVTILTPISGG